MIEIVPAIIAKNYEEMEERIKMVEPYVGRVQVDIMDGEFVPNQTINGYDDLKKLDTNVKIEVHLMVKDPKEYVEKLIETGKVDKYILHIESDADFDYLIKLIHDNGYIVGLTLNPETPNGNLSEYFEKIDFIQFMTVDPGFYGSPFVESVLDKMIDLRNMRSDVVMQVDGGIDAETAKKVVEVGATTLVSGSYIFNSDDIASAINILKNTGK